MQTKEKPLVTILTLVYNNAEYVLPALQHIKEQLYTPIEHIIVDDQSSDGSADTIKKWIDDNNYNCEFIVHKINKGICATLNEIILRGKGKYIFGASDDLMMPDKLIKDVEYLEANPSFAFCSSKMIIRNFKENTDKKKEYYPTSFKDLLYGKSTIASPTATYRRQALIDIGLFDETLLFEDYDMFLRLLHKYPAGFRDDYSVIYCVHEKSIQTQREVEFQEDFFKVYKKWRHLPDYRLFTNKRHAFTFWYFSDKNKKAALRHLIPASTFFWRAVFIKGLIKFLFFYDKRI